MKSIKKVLSLSLAIMMAATVMPADMMKMIGIEIKQVAADSLFAEDITEEDGKDVFAFAKYFKHMPNDVKGSATQSVNDLVWSGQHWFNYTYCKNYYGKLNTSDDLIEDDVIKRISESIETSENKYSDIYIDGNLSEYSYERMIPNGNDYYDTFRVLIIALQVELINAGYLDYDIAKQGWGSFGLRTSEAFDSMLEQEGGIKCLLKEERKDIVRILQYALAAKGYWSEFNDKSFMVFTDLKFSYSDGILCKLENDELQYNSNSVLSALKDMINDCGLSEIVDLKKDFNSLIMKAVLNTDAYVIGDNHTKAEEKTHDFQRFLNANTYGCIYHDDDDTEVKMGIFPCDGHYSRDTNKQMIFLYQKLLFEKNNVSVEPNGYFGKNTLKYTPEKIDLYTDYGDRNIERDTNIFRIIKMALFFNLYDHVEQEILYNPDSSADGMNFYDIATANAILKYKLKMSLDNPDDTTIDRKLIASLFSSCGDQSRSFNGCDTSKQLKSQSYVDVLKANGIEYVGRYIGDESYSSKRLSKEEAELLVSNNIKIIPIYQGYYNFDDKDPSGFNKERGTEDVKATVEAAEELGIPKGSTIYYAIDMDVYDYQIDDTIIEYFKSLTTEMARYKNVYKIGIYSSRNTCQRVYDAGYCTNSYVSDSSTGYSGNTAFPMPTNWTFDQFSTDETIGDENVSFLIDKLNVSRHDTDYSNVDPAVSRLDRTAETYFDIKYDTPKSYDELEGEKIGDPVDLASGAHTIEYSAVSVYGARNIDFTLSYSSAELFDGEVGIGWNHNYEKHLEKGETVYDFYDFDKLSSEDLDINSVYNEIREEYIVVYDSSNRCTKYIKSESDPALYIPERASGNTENDSYDIRNGYSLKNEDDQWILNCNNKEWYYFDSEGRLIGHKNKEGLKLDISFVKDDFAKGFIITEPVSEKSVTVLKNEIGKINKIYTNASEKCVELSYNEKSELTSIKDLNGNVTDYSYDTNVPGRIISGTDNDGTVYFTDSYYNFDSVAYKYYDAFRETYDQFKNNSNEELISSQSFIDYVKHQPEYRLKKGRISKQTDAKKHDTLFDYEMTCDCDGNNWLIVTTYDRNESGKETETRRSSKSIFNVNNMLVSYTDSNGSETKYEIDPKSYNILTITDPAGFTEKRQYDSRNNVIGLIDKTGIITNYEYYENTDNVKSEIKCDKNSNEISRISYEYYDNNLLKKITDERGNETSYEYDSNNLLISKKIKYVKSVTGDTSEYGEKVFKYKYNKGLLTSILDPDGNIAGTENNEGNNTVIITNSGDGKKDSVLTIKENKYDDYGNVLSEKIILNETESRTIEHVYNCRDLETKTSDDNGTISKKDYDGNGNMVSSTDECGNTIKYDYDNEDRIIKITDPEGNTSKIEYDCGGRIIKKYDSEEVLTEYSYNTADNKVEKVIKEKDENGEYQIVDKTTTEYDGNGKVLSVTDYNDTVTLNCYNDRDYLEKTIYAYGTDAECTKKYEYNEYGDLTKTIILLDDEKEIIEQYEYDSFGNQISYTDGNGNKTVFTYDNCGRKKTETNALNLTTTYNYDRFGNLESVISPDNHITKYEYDYQGRQISVTDPLGNVSKTNYDIRDNIKETFDKTGKGKTSYTYYENNKLKSQTDSYNNEVKYEYDKSGRLLNKTDALGNVTRYSYDKNGKLKETTDALNNIVSTEYDALGNTTSINDKYFSSVSYTYDISGNITSRSGGFGESITYDYNVLNQCTSETNGRKQKTQYTYDKAGRLTDFVQYDAEGKEINKGSFKYDNCGNILEAQDKSGTIKRKYDVLNRLTEYTDTYGNTVKYNYDNESNISKIVYPSAGTENEISVSYKYDAAANIISVTDWNGKTTKFEYDENGNIKSEKRPNNTVLTIQYDTNGNVKSIYEKNESDEKITSYSYSYNGNGKLVSENDNVNNIVNSMKYDDLGRLTSRTSTDGNALFDYRVNVIKSVGSMSSEEFSRRLLNYDIGITKKEGYDYDASGNIKTSVKDVYKNGEAVNSLYVRSYEYSKGNQLKNYTDINGKAVKDAEAAFKLGITPFGVSNVPAYDADGNMTALSENGKDVSLGYDINNHLTIYGETEYTYDVEGNLIKEKKGSTETTYLYDTTFGVPRVLVSTTGDEKTYYVYGNDLIKEVNADGVKYYHYDLKGSTVALTDEKGKVTDRYRYESFGKTEHVEGTSETPFKYAATSGVMTNKNGLMYMYTRYYDPELMRFLSADILTGKSGNTQSLNRYAYCEGDPVNYTDPFGTSPEIRAKKKYNRISKTSHGALDVAGMIPVFGIVFDSVNTVWYLVDGEYGLALLSGTAIIPVIGEGTAATKISGKVTWEVMSYVDDAEIYVAKYGDDVSDILRTGAFFKASTFEEVNKFINSTDARLVENEYFNNGVRVATRKQIRKYKKEMSSKGINVVVDKKGKILDYTKAAGFDYSSGTVYIKSKPGVLDLYHEGYHAEQFIDIGQDAYIKLGQLSREEYVYSRIVENSHLFNDAELNASFKYINRLRNK